MWPITSSVKRKKNWCGTHKHIIHHPHSSWQCGLWVRVINSRWASCNAVAYVCRGAMSLPGKTCVIDKTASRVLDRDLGAETDILCPFICAWICQASICFSIIHASLVLLNCLLIMMEVSEVSHNLFGYSAHFSPSWKTHEHLKIEWRSALFINNS